MKLVAGAVIAVLTLAYPFLVYFGLQQFSPALFSVLIFAVALLRFVSSKRRGGLDQLAVLAIALLFSFALALSDSEFLLRLYPVIISLAIAAVFGLSLREDEALITQIARSTGKEITAQAERYTRKLTALWALLLLANAVVALYLALEASLEHWMLYCGFISYLIFGAIALIELAYRQYYIARYGR